MTKGYAAIIWTLPLLLLALIPVICFATLLAAMV